MGGPSFLPAGGNTPSALRHGVLTEYRGPGGIEAVPSGVTETGDGASLAYTFRRTSSRSATMPSPAVPACPSSRSRGASPGAAGTSSPARSRRRPRILHLERGLSRTLDLRLGQSIAFSLDLSLDLNLCLDWDPDLELSLSMTTRLSVKLTLGQGRTCSAA